MADPMNCIDCGKPLDAHSGIGLECTTQPPEQEVAWKMEFKDSEIEFVAHATGEVYLSFNWNGTGVWEYVGHTGEKSFPDWLRKVADKMQEKLS